VRAPVVARACALTLLLFLPRCAGAPPSHPLPTAPATVPIEPAAESWPRREVLDLALRAYRCGEREGRFRRPVLTVIDYSLPSTEARLWVIDLDRNVVLYHEPVAHGDGSGVVLPTAFSNRIGSHQSSLGLFRTDETYMGRFGYALRLSGLEPGFNDHARRRAIVVHGFPGVSEAYIAHGGTIGRSWGCPALPEEIAPQVIDHIAGGSAIFAYYPDKDWLRESHYLHCDTEIAAAQR
jgi:hypothetical protein